MKEISRRNFIKGAAASALSVAALGKLGGFTTQAAAEETPAAADQYAPNELIPNAYLNPQRTDFRTNTKELRTLFSPLKIGPLELSHRMVKTAAGSACYLAGLTDELLQYYVNFAKGGVELIYVEGIGEMEPPADGSEMPAETVAFIKKLVEECGKYGASLGYQWAQFGANENTMTADEIHAIQDRGVAIAKSFHDLGFKAIEMNAAGFNMGEHFLSRFYNTRDDEYGIGSFENRARFVTEWIQKVKAECGEDFIVQILIDCLEENDNIANNPTLFTPDKAVTTPHSKVTTVEEGIEMAKLFEAAGADCMHLRLGPLGHHVAQFGSDLY
ncbi:MAG: twin-arginine translocation signal domain-containing protein, partial [Oscillospiraceae bacterium]|nr:twin-arginine translocation signal domain-containing protein [Oscillospiraceae bacterium]